MKIRTGFVSNSSSSSFCIYGCEIDYEQYKKLEDDPLIRSLKHIQRFAMSDYGYFVGREFNSIEDNETGKEFKDSTERAIEALIGKDQEIDIIEQAWND